MIEVMGCLVLVTVTVDPSAQDSRCYWLGVDKLRFNWSIHSSHNTFCKDCFSFRYLFKFDNLCLNVRFQEHLYIHLAMHFVNGKSFVCLKWTLFHLAQSTTPRFICRNKIFVALICFSPLVKSSRIS